MGNRKAAMAELVKWYEKMLPGSENTRIMTEALEKLSDKQFEDYMRKLESSEEILPIQAPNLSKTKITIERNLKIAEELGFPLRQHLILIQPTTGTEYRTPKKFLVMDLPLRLQQQLLVKKKSIPDDNRHVDELTGQPTGDSHGSSLSAPETQVLRAQGYDRSIEELLKFRGGDTRAFQEMNRQIIATGGASQDAIKRTPSKVKSVETLSVLLKSAHIDNTL